MDEMTPAQERVYRFVETTIAARRAPPTRAEIARGLGFASGNAAQAHLRALARKGYVRLGIGRSRAIDLLGGPRSSTGQAESAETELAVIGRVAAGGPILAVENVERRLRIAPTFFTRRPDYLLRVVGESMRDGIRHGDLIAVARTTRLPPGAIGVFRYDDEVTVKRLIEDDDTGPRLVADNPDFPDIVPGDDKDRVAVEGEAVGVIRAL